MESFWAMGHFSLGKCTALAAVDGPRVFLKQPDAPGGRSSGGTCSNNIRNHCPPRQPDMFSDTGLHGGSVINS